MHERGAESNCIKVESCGGKGMCDTLRLTSDEQWDRGGCGLFTLSWRWESTRWSEVWSLWGTRTSFAMKEMCNRNTRSVVMDVKKMSYESVLVLTPMCGSEMRVREWNKLHAKKIKCLRSMCGWWKCRWLEMQWVWMKDFNVAWKRVA